ncbi:SDR family oxidoreductase [Streptomyces sp. NPDC093225]|uniref:SDR family oxidoreductase n=1 Tax=Streptomyces sp. NPDC093225 TaxID=3366034 RepID=UPI00381EF369
MSILITGATGFLGCRLVRELLARPGTEPVTVLGRGTEADLRARTEAAIAWLDAPPLPQAALGRLRFVSGDITKPGLGLKQGTRDRVTDGLTQIWHSAALLHLDGDPVPLHRTNVLGTRHVLDLADHAPSARLVHVSTAYVAGRRRTGHILEDDLSEDDGFHCAYEETKYTAETAVHAWARIRSRTALILRPSLLTADRPTPEGLPRQPLDTLTHLIEVQTHSWPLRTRGFTTGTGQGRGRGDTLHVRLLADPDGSLNLLQADFAAHAMVRAAEGPLGEQPVRTLHLTHPQNTSLRTLLGAIERRFPFMTVLPVDEIPDPTRVEALSTQQAGPFLGYFTQRRTYDRTHLLEATHGLADPKPIDEDYLLRALQPVGAVNA